MKNEYATTLLMTRFITHDVKQLIVRRPENFDFSPGQGVNLAIDQPKWRDKARPFTPTGIPNDDALEFTIKSYPKHEGVTRELHCLSPGATLNLSKPFGTISYQGPGVFIAGGAGITPFLSIFRQRAAFGDLEKCTLIFSNKTISDIICERELKHYFNNRGIFVCTEESSPGYLQQRIDEPLLRKCIDDFEQRFYLCGPPGFMESVSKTLKKLGANPKQLVFEQ